ncbi:hypothetical protein JL107_00165 [Nakamurella flavida]|uniref:Fatty acid kinase subunit A-like middle domain-containing protein n=1 Tax=Nakamurella flavida TaxID=363630 RepID=A0A938YKZ6_9ACTN|nr:hypothetical protein [Nakamurella flavida]MBM9474850.1 hypothetical protein [Nakamurella flavida]MDP9776420.1 hypothetical protein [Nakamurella flavida]
MTSLDADLVHRWFATVLNPDVPVMPHWGILPSAVEGAVLREGRQLLLAAVVDSTMPGPPEVAASEPAAREVQTYLHALAAGIAGTQAALLEADGPTQPTQGSVSRLTGGPFGAAEPVDPPGEAPTIALVTGLIAGAAALRDSLNRPGPPEVPNREPSAAEAARLAGVSAAEVVVDGADLHAVAAISAATAMQGWGVGQPTDPRDRVEYRTRGLIGMLLVGLEQASQTPDPPAVPAACGAGPGENRGRAFTAEVTFEIRCGTSESAALHQDLLALGEDVQWWSRSGVDHFHIHTDSPGEVISQAYASGTLFDLAVTLREPTPSDLD